MKKRMIGVVILGAVLLTGCSKDGINFTKSDTWDTKWHVQEERRPGNIVPYQNGFYYIGEPSCLSYYDIESEQSVVLCSKNGCSHDNKNCFAYIEEMPEIHDDKLYFVSHEGVVSVANADNTEKEKKFTLLEKQKADGNIAFVSGFLMSEDSLFFRAQITTYTKNDGEKNLHALYVLNLNSKKEQLIMETDTREKELEMISASGDVLYYSCSDNNRGGHNLIDSSQEDWMEIEETTHSELYRWAGKKKESEKVFEIDNGFWMAATDELGVYYTEFAGTGYMGCSKLFRVRPNEKEAELVYTANTSNGFWYGTRSAEYVFIQEEDSSGLYQLDMMKPVSVDWEYPRQCAFAYPVSGGFAVPAREGIDGEERNYVGEEKKFIPFHTN